MKRFLMFLVIAIAVTSLGLSIYYFAKDNEVIFINNTQISVNAGDTFKADDLLTFKNASKHTKVDYNGVKNDKVLTYNKKEGYYAAVKGGETKIVITTTNRAYSNLVIKVIVRDGTEEFPYIIDSEEELRSIGVTKEGNKFTTSAHYELGKSIILTEKWTPIENFTGSINGAGYTISNIDISEYTQEEIDATKIDNAGTPVETAKTAAYTEYNTALATITSAGLIGNLTVSDDGVVGKITNLNLKNVNIKGNFDYVGAIAGQNNGEIRNCETSTDSYVKYIYVEGKVESEEVIYNNIQSIKSGAYVGGIAGYNTGISKTISGEVKNFVPVLDRVSSHARIKLSASQEVGGLVGRNVAGQITECYFDGYAISDVAALKFGGIAYKNLAGGTYESSIIDCYTIVKTLDSKPVTDVGGILYTNVPTGLEDVKEHHIFGTYHSALRTYAEDGTYTETDIEIFGDTASDSDYAKNSRQLTAAELKETLNYITYKQVVNGSDYTRTWDFSDVWKMGEEAPTLNKDANNGSVYLIDYSSVKGSNDFSSSDSPQDIYDKLALGSGSYNVASDIDMKGFEWTPIASYSGTLTGSDINDGNGGTRAPIISNIVLVLPDPDANQGLFNELTKDAIINNITFKDVTIKAAPANVDASARYVGTLAGASMGANINGVTINNVLVENLTLVGFGGLVGYNEYEANHAVTNVTVDGVIFSGSYAQVAGGITAANNAIISGTEQKGTQPAFYVTANNISLCGNQIGGIAGCNYRTIVYAKANLNTTMTSDNDKVYGVKNYIQVGGIAAFNKSTGLIKNVEGSGNFSVDTVKGYTVYVGGIVGFNSGSIYYAAARSLNIGTTYSYEVYAGGIAGISDGVIYGCYVDTSVSIIASTTAIEKNNESYVGGLVGGLATAKSANKVGLVSNSVVKASTLNGFYVGGLIGYSYGSVTRSYVEGTYIKGFYAGGLAGIINTAIANDAPMKSYDDSNSGLFKYDYAVVSIENVNSDIDMSTLSQVDIYNSVAKYDKGASAGIAVLVVYGSEVNNCYTVTNFIGEGVKASTTISRECGSSNANTRKGAYAGVIKNTIYTSKQMSIGTEGGRHVEEEKLKLPAGSGYHKALINNGFDMAEWTAEVGQLPRIVGVDALIANNIVF